MGIKHTDPNAAQLRLEAEARLARTPNKGLKQGSTEELLHELQVHQIELEMQNETLRQAQNELEESRDRYVSLYEFAPVGYLTLTDADMISEINLTGSALLKVERNKLLHRRFATFVATEDRDRWYRQFVSVLQRGERQSCELSLQRGDGSAFYAQLDCLRLAKGGEPPVVRIMLTDITRLRESEEKFKAIFDSAKDGILLADMEDKKLLLGNATACLMLGYTAEEISKLHVMDIHPENDLPYVLSEFEKQARGNKVVAENIPVKRKDGSVFYAEITTAPLNIGGKTYLAGFFRDTTERRQAEEALQQSEADLRALVEHSPVAMIVDVGVDADEKILMMNRKFTELFGYTMEDVPDVRHWWPLAYPDEKYREELKAEWIGKVGKAIQNHSAIEPMETTVSCKDGSSRYIKFSLSSIGNRNIITFEDLTERNQAEDSLRKLSLAVEQSPSSIIITDLDANIEYANAAFVKTTGYSLPEVVGKNPRLLHSGKTPRATYDDLWAHLTRGEMWKGEFINRRKDGSEYVEAVLFSPVRQPDGRVTNYLAIKEDITERKQAEAKLAEQVEDLGRWHDATIGREMRVLDLKHEVNELLGQTGQPPRYPSAESDEPE